MATIQKKDTPLTVSVIIGVYNRPHLAAQLAETIHAQDPTVEIIVVEQGHKHINPQSDLYRYVYMATPGLPEARNRGLQEATGDIVLYLDDDVEITKETITGHKQAYTDETVVAVAGRVINDGEQLPKDTNVTAGKTNALATVFLKQFWSTKKQNVDFPYGCNMSYRRQALVTTGGFDEYLDYFDEIDAAVRIRTQGNLLFDPRTLVYHHKAQTGGTRQKKTNKTREVYRCYGYYIAKHVPFPLSLISMVLRSRTALFETPPVLGALWKGYVHQLRTFI